MYEVWAGDRYFATFSTFELARSEAKALGLLARCGTRVVRTTYAVLEALGS